MDLIIIKNGCWLKERNWKKTFQFILQEYGIDKQIYNIRLKWMKSDE